MGFIISEPDVRDLALDVVVLFAHRALLEGGSCVGGGYVVERILKGTGTGGLGGLHGIVSGLAVERVEIGLALHGLGRSALVVGNLTVDDHIVAHLDLGVALYPLAVAQVERTEDVELAVVGAVVADVEAGVAEALANLAVVGYRGNLTLDVVDFLGHSALFKGGADVVGGHAVVRILKGAAAAGLGGLYYHRLVGGLAVERVEIALLRGGLGGAVEVGELTADNHLVAQIDLGVALYPALVFQVVGGVDEELAGFGTVIADGEGGGAVGFIISKPDVRDFALDVVVLLGHRTLLECGGGIGGGYVVERILKSTGAGGLVGLDNHGLVGGLAVERVEIALFRGGLGSAVVVGELTADDDLVAQLDLGVALYPWLVLQEVGGVDLELVVLAAVVANKEGGGAVRGAEGKLDL